MSPVPRALAAILLAGAVPTPTLAETAPANPPRLIVAIAVDQFSGDLFTEYREHFSGGLRRLAAGAVFPRGYQSHAATETCPGHSTILTGDRPARTGIIGNTWFDQRIARADKRVYCAEDEHAPASGSRNYVVSARHLRVPTLGDRMKRVDPASRAVAVSGKDRAAVMMGGGQADEIWWWSGTGFASLAGRAVPEPVTRTNAAAAARVAQAQPAMALPDWCTARDAPVTLEGGRQVGTGRFDRAGGDAQSFGASPELDDATLDLASAMVDAMKLGAKGHSDLLAISLSATDYIGHRYGTQGSEMCLQVAALDRALGKFFDGLDARGLDYVVVLTADHGGHDTPERNRDHAVPDDARVKALLTPDGMNTTLGIAAGIGKRIFLGDSAAGDWYLSTKLSPAERTRAVAAARAIWAESGQVEAVFTRAQIMASPMPSGPPEEWTLLQRARASVDPERSGDLVVLLKPRVTPIANPSGGYIATHGSPWDYDRRVPILFWRKGMAGFEQPNSVETVDIMPTLAALIGLPLGPGEVDGRCLDLDPGAGTTCP